MTACLGSLDSSRDLHANCAMRFLFRLDLSLHAGAGKKIGILNFATKQGVNDLATS